MSRHLVQLWQAHVHLPRKASFGASGPMRYDGERRRRAPVNSQHPSAPAPVVRIGGRYEVRGVLGRGGMGVVYHASDLADGRGVALKKLLLPDYANLHRDSVGFARTTLTAPGPSTTIATTGPAVMNSSSSG